MAGHHSPNFRHKNIAPQGWKHPRVSSHFAAKGCFGWTLLVVFFLQQQGFLPGTSGRFSGSESEISGFFRMWFFPWSLDIHAEKSHGYLWNVAICCDMAFYNDDDHISEVLAGFVILQSIAIFYTLLCWDLFQVYNTKTICFPTKNLKSWCGQFIWFPGLRQTTP